MQEVMRDAWNHAMLVMSLYAVWTVALAYIGAKNILWDYDLFNDADEPKFEPVFAALAE